MVGGSADKHKHSMVLTVHEPSQGCNPSPETLTTPSDLMVPTLFSATQA